MNIDAPLDAAPVRIPANTLLTLPILPTLLTLALPNTVAMFGDTLVAVAEPSYIGRLGTEPLGAIAIWLVNTLASVLRGTGDMRLPSATLIVAAIVQIVVGGTLGLGLAGLPQFGMRGVAAGQLAAFSLGAIFLSWYLISGRSRLMLNFCAFPFQRAMFVGILKVRGGLCLATLHALLTILIFTRILAGFGTETLAG